MRLNITIFKFSHSRKVIEIKWFEEKKFVKLYCPLEFRTETYVLTVFLILKGGRPLISLESFGQYSVLDPGWQTESEF